MNLYSNSDKGVERERPLSELERDKFEDVLRKITVRGQEEWFEFVFELEPTWADGRVQQLSELERDKFEDLLRKISLVVLCPSTG